MGRALPRHQRVLQRRHLDRTAGPGAVAAGLGGTGRRQRPGHRRGHRPDDPDQPALLRVLAARSPLAGPAELADAAGAGHVGPPDPVWRRGHVHLRSRCHAPRCERSAASVVGRLPLGHDAHGRVQRGGHRGHEPPHPAGNHGPDVHWRLPGLDGRRHQDRDLRRAVVDRLVRPAATRRDPVLGPAPAPSGSPTRPPCWSCWRWASSPSRWAC